MSDPAPGGGGRIRAWIGKVLKVKDTPEALARGLAIGFFFGVSFFWGLQIWLALLVSHLARGNKVVAAAMTAISNPLTSLPLYTFCYLVGHFVVGGEGALPDLAALDSLDEILALGPRFFATMLVGTTLVGVAGGIAVYFGANRILGALRRWHERREARRRHEPETVAPPHPASQKEEDP